MATPISESKRQEVRDLIRQGASNRAAAAAAGVSHETARRIRSSMPFSGAAQSAAIVPAPNWNTDQPPPAAQPLTFDPRYHGHQFKSFIAPLAFAGWSVDRMRAAIELHDQGIFLESSTLGYATTRFGPVLAALQQRIAPALALPRQVHGGARGLARLLSAEVEAQLAPRQGLLPSPYFPPWLWGAMSIDLAMLNFTVLQHVLGDEDPETGVRPMYTRRWPPWAVQYFRYRRTFVAITTDGPVDILNDGKFTLVCDEEEPHLNAAVRALGSVVMDGALAQQARASYIDRYGNPKWVGFMPEKVAVRSEEGLEFFQALATIQGPDGYGALPHGADYKVAEMSGAHSGVFKDTLENVWQFVAAILLGSDGTMSKGSGGVYSAPIFAGVRRDLISRLLTCMVRGVNQGHIAPWLVFNYAASIAEAAGWVDPVLDIPLPDPEKDARIKSLADRMKMLTDQVVAERAAGFIVDQERVEKLAIDLDVSAPVLAEQAPKGGEIFEYHITNKLVAPDEVRARLDLPPLPDDAGSVEQLAKEREAGKDKVGAGTGLASGFPESQKTEQEGV